MNRLTIAVLAGRRRPGVHRVTVDVSASAPGGRALVRRRVRVRIVPRPALPLRTPLDVRARRRGRVVVVRWRTAGRARRMLFTVIGQHGRGGTTFAPFSADFVPGPGRTRFVARLRPERLRDVRWVRVYAGSLDRGGNRSVLVPVR